MDIEEFKKIAERAYKYEVHCVVTIIDGEEKFAEIPLSGGPGNMVKGIALGALMKETYRGTQEDTSTTEEVSSESSSEDEFESSSSSTVRDEEELFEDDDEYFDPDN